MKISLKKMIFVLLMGFLLAGSIYGVTKSLDKSNSRKIYFRNETGDTGENDGGTGEETITPDEPSIGDPPELPGGDEGGDDGGSENNTGTEFEEGVTQECKDYFTEHDPLWRYGIKMSLNDEKTVATITMNAPTIEEKTIDDAIKAMAFRIVKINNSDVSSDENYSAPSMILKNKGSIAVAANFIKEDDENVMKVYLESALNTQDPVCTGKSHFEVQNYSEGAAVTEEVSIGGAEAKQETFYSASQCNVEDISTITDEKLKEYCEYINSAKGATSSIIINGDSDEYKDLFENNRFKNTKIFSFTCPAVGADGKIAASLFRKDSGDKYYINHAYLEATKKYPVHNGVTYDYNYAPGLANDEIGHDTSGSCEVTCTEKVTVDYGPPQVVRAGICLEYFIKVKSVVDCQSTTEVKPPKSNFNYCVPVPWCTHATSGQLLHQAGPDDNFDDCIESCDGGKYTTKCSDICYKKLYGSSSAFNNMYSFDSYSNHAGKVLSTSDISGLTECYDISKSYPFRTWKYTTGQDSGIFYQEGTHIYPELNGRGPIYVKPDKTNGAYYGCYYWSGSSIKWWGNDSYTPARWYSVRDDYYYPSGKPYAVLTEGEACVYATDGSQQCGKPYGTKNNRDGFFYKWKSGGLCDANCYYSGCSKKDYLNPGMMKADYDANMEKYNSVISACNAAAACSTSTATYKVLVDEGIRDVEKTTDFTDSKSVRPQEEDVSAKLNNSKYLVDFGGCYTRAYDKGSIYKAEIGVQTTWLRNKDGVVSYVKPKSTKSYVKKDHQYCLPADISEVNKKWWLFFYTSYYKDLGPYSINDDALQDILNFHAVTEFEEKDVEKYNIKGEIRNFGHFGWNFDISCFYAYGKLDDHLESVPEYRIRTVDLANLFPAESESGTRLPGFNWSKYSDGSEKTGDFEIQPSKYAKWVEEKNYSVYSDAYLDYEIQLSASDVRDIRKNANTYLGNVTGQDFKANDVLNYESQLLKKLQDEKGKDKIKKPKPESFAFKCNNIVNYSVEDKCDDSISKVTVSPTDPVEENPGNAKDPNNGSEKEITVMSDKQKEIASTNNIVSPKLEK